MDKKIVSRRELGQQGEALAAEYLIEQGYSIRDRNVRTPYGEIDLIAQAGALVVFVEVKTRTNLRFGYPESAINRQKQAHMIDSISAFLQSHPELECDWRVDVISIILSGADEKPRITHFENALTS